MNRSSLQNLITDLLAPPRAAPEVESSLLLAFGYVVDFLQKRGHRLDIRPSGLKEPRSVGFSTYRADIALADGDSVPGYALGVGDTIRIVAAIEAFERYLFKEVLPEIGQGTYPAVRLLSGEPTEAEAAAVLGDGQRYPSTTSGMACHTSFAEALLAACLELCERDVLLRQWFAGIPPSAVERPKSPLDRLVTGVLAEERFEVATGLYQGPGGVPVAVAALHSLEHRLFFLGTGAALSKGLAIEKALREAVAIWAFDYFPWLWRGGDVSSFPDDSQAKRHSVRYEALRQFFVADRTREDAGTVDDPRVILESLLRHYDFVAVPVPLAVGDPGEPAALAAVKVLSSHAVPLFHGEFPLVLPTNFAILKEITDRDHPY